MSDTQSTWYATSQFRGVFDRKIFIADLQNVKKEDGKTDISKMVTNVSVNYTMDFASELSFDIIDSNLDMAKNNYFTLGRDVIYETQTIGTLEAHTSTATMVRQLFEISDVTVSQSPGGSPIFSVKCFTKAVQQMKRDKKSAGTIKGQGSAFVRNAAAKYGLKFYGQETTKKQKITKSKGEKQAESLWDVIKRLAGDAKFVCYEVDGYLVFASEKWLLQKWGTESKVVPKMVRNKRTGQKEQKGTKTIYWIPLQFPNSGPGYNGRPGYFKLIEYPTITKKENDPYAAEGSCTVERINGTQIRPGMTAYVGIVPNMSGYYLVDSVSFNEMVPEPVAVTFRTPQRDEEKEKPRLLPIGQVYQQTYVPNARTSPIEVITVKESAKEESGKAVVSASLDSRILPLPTESSPFQYPRMKYANLSTTLSSFSNILGPGKSTNDFECVVSTGNLNLWDRPILPSPQGPQTTYSLTLEFESGSEWRAGLVPLVYTTDGQAVLVSASAITAYVDGIGRAAYFAGAGRHLGVVRGDTKAKAILNARDYAFLISRQQEAILLNRLFEFSLTDISKMPNTPGGADSVWPAV